MRDLESDKLHSVRDILATKFEAYGVMIEQVNICTVIIPKTMRIDLTLTTEYDVKLQFQDKK